MPKVLEVKIDSTHYFNAISKRELEEYEKQEFLKLLRRISDLYLFERNHLTEAEIIDQK